MTGNIIEKIEANIAHVEQQLKARQDFIKETEASIKKMEADLVMKRSEAVLFDGALQAYRESLRLVKEDGVVVTMDAAPIEAELVSEGT